jgi:transcriptional regulator with XRE-family HTH domain
VAARELTWAAVLDSLCCTDSEALYWNRVQSMVRLRDLARQLCIRPQTLSAWEHDRAIITPEIKERHSAALAVLLRERHGQV